VTGYEWLREGPRPCRSTHVSSPWSLLRCTLKTREPPVGVLERTAPPGGGRDRVGDSNPSIPARLAHYPVPPLLTDYAGMR